MDNAETIWRWFWERIGNAYGVAGLMGNLASESGLKPDNLQNSYERLLGMSDREYTDAVDSGAYDMDRFCTDGAGYGLPQFSYPARKRLLWTRAKERRKSVGDLGLQLDVIWEELSQREFRGVLNTLFTARSVREASDAVLLGYEKPADQSEGNKEARADMSQMFYERYAADESVKSTARQLTIYKRLFYDSDCYKQGTAQTPKGVQVHSTGANNPYLKRYVQPDDGRLGYNPNVNDHNHPGGNVCANAYIGKLEDGTVAVYQTLPWDMRCWLSGNYDSSDKSKPNANRLGYIGFEICEDGLTNRQYFDEVMDKAVLLTAYLCDAYDIDPDNVRDHSELNGMKLASEHKDIGHWLENFGETMDGFRAKVREAMTEPIDVEYIDCDEVKVLYKAIVDNPDRWLNVRSGPSKNYKVVFQVEKGSTVDVLNDGNADWWQIQQNGKTGYAMSQYLKKVQEEEKPDDPEPAPPVQKGVIISEELAMSLFEALAPQLGYTIDCRSGNVCNIDYMRERGRRQ